MVLYEMQAQCEENILNENNRGEMCYLLPDGKRKNQRSRKKLDTKWELNEVNEIVKQVMGTQERASTTNKQPVSTMQNRSVL